jgi:hypothetical protein
VEQPENQAVERDDRDDLQGEQAVAGEDGAAEADRRVSTGTCDSAFLDRTPRQRLSQ